MLPILHMQTFSFRLDIRALLSNRKNYVMYLGFMIVVKLPRVVNYPVRCAMSPLLLAHSRAIKGKTKTPVANSLLAPSSPGIRLLQLSRFPISFRWIHRSKTQVHSQSQSQRPFSGTIRTKRLSWEHAEQHLTTSNRTPPPLAPLWRLSFPLFPSSRFFKLPAVRNLKCLTQYHLRHSAQVIFNK